MRDNHRDRLMSCEHWSPINAPQAGHCALHCVTLSLGCCRDCRFNTAPGTFPPPARQAAAAGLPTPLRDPAATSPGPCGCTKRKATQ